MNNGRKILNIVAGPNGSGKTTFAKSFLAERRDAPVFLNPDLIAAGISLREDQNASFQAGRLLLADIKSRLSGGESFGFESTLSGRTYLPLLRVAASKGYSITIYFLFVGSTEILLQRIKKRVRQGGHDIPRSAVLRRQGRCFGNFWNLYRPLAKDWYLFNNSSSFPKLALSKADFEAWDTAERERFAALFVKGKAR